MKTSMTIERLRQVVRVLEELPKEAGFDLDCWQCGTVACAAGWATQDLWFNERGFTMSPAIDCPTFRGHYGFDAIGDFFGFDLSQSRALFSSKAYARGSKYYVIRRINAFCNKLEKASA